MKEKTRNTSARKKLVPAVAMLTTSAIMLSSATYAWFTLNKEVEVTGLQMEAVAGDALEISLGAFSDNKYNPSTAPTKEDSGWKRSIDWSEAYSGFGALKPASSNVAAQLMTVNEQGVVAGGRAVTADTAVYVVDGATYPEAENVLKGTSASENGPTEGYYIDVPMWIRTNKTNVAASEEATPAEVPIDCTVTITTGETGESTEELMKAVRVAIIPTNKADTSAFSIAPAVTGGAVSTASGMTETIFGLDNQTYNTKVIKSGNADVTYSAANLAAVPTVYQAASELIETDLDGETVDPKDDANNSPRKLVFTVPSAAENDYSGCSFIVRIWIEGESIYCNDATANQDWRVDLNFAISDSDSGSAGTPAATGAASESGSST